MLKKIDFIEPSSLGKTLASIFFSVGVVSFIMHAIQTLVASSWSLKAMGLYLGLLCLLPIGGFIAGVLIGHVYNVSASWIGGIEIGVEDQ